MSSFQNAVRAVFKSEQEWQDQGEIGKLPTHFKPEILFTEIRK